MSDSTAANQNGHSRSDTLEFLQDGGEMGTLIRSFDWSATAVGKAEAWPQSLKTVVSIILRSGYPMFVWWGKELINFNNDAYVPLLGDKYHTAIGKSGKEIWAEIWDQIGPMVGEVFLKRQVYKKDLLLFINRNGISEETYFNFSYSPIIDEQGAVGGLFCACHEESDKVLQQRRLELQSELNFYLAQLNHINEVGPATIDILKKDFRDIPFTAYYDIIASEERLMLVRSSGFSDTDMPFPSDVSLNDVGSDLFRFQEMIRTRKPQLVHGVTGKVDNPLITQEGTFSAYVIPIKKLEKTDLNGVLILGISQNRLFDESYKAFYRHLVFQIASAIERLQIKAEIQRQKDRLERFFMQAPGAICILDGPDMIYELVNPAYQQLFPGRDIAGKPLREALPESVKTSTYKILQDVYRTGKSVEIREMLFPLARYEHTPIEDLYFNYIVQPRLNEQGVIDGLLVFAFEVTEQKKAEEALKKSQKELDAANKAIKSHNIELSKNNLELTKINNDLDNFIYTASHDLRAPVSNMEGLLNMLSLETKISEEQQPWIKLINQSVERLKNTIKDLTEISKVQKGSDEDVEVINIRNLIAEVLLTLENNIEEGQAQIDLDLKAEEIEFSRKNLRSILYNLISNSIKYAAPQRRPYIKMLTYTKNGYYVISVKDNGLGMSQEDLRKLFGMFKRFHQHVEGTGIGLYMIKRMVENAGGKIEVDSQLNAGTEFRVFLPVKRKGIRNKR